TLTVKADIATTARAGNENAFEIVDEKSISTSAATQTVQLPIVGSTLRIAGASAGTATIEANGSIAEIRIGDKEAKVCQFKISASSEDLNMNAISLRINGTIDQNNDMSNWVLKKGSDVLATTEKVNSEDLAVFKLKTPDKVEEGNNSIYAAYADILASADPNETIQCYLEERTDLVMIGEVYGYGAQVTNTNFGTVATGNSTSVKGGQVTVTFKGPVAQNVARNAKDLSFLDLDLTSQRNIIVKKLQIKVHAGTTGTDWAGGTASTGGLMNGTASSNYTDLKFINRDTGKNLFGSQEITTFTADSPVETGFTKSEFFTLTFTGDVSVKAGATLPVAVTADVSTTAGEADQIWFELVAISNSEGIKYDGSGNVFVSDIVPASAIVGNKMTILPASLTVSLASSPTSQTFVKGSSNVESVGIIFKASQSSLVTVTDLTLTGYLDENNDGTFTEATDNSVKVKEIVEYVELYDSDGNKISEDRKSFNDSGKAIFNGLKWVIPKGATVKLVPKIKISTNAFRNNTVDKVGVAIKANGDITALDQESNTLTASVGTGVNTTSATPPTITTIITIRQTGTLTIAAGGTAVASKVVQAGSQNVLSQRIKLTSQFEGFRMSKLTLQNVLHGTESPNNSAVKSVTIKYAKNAAAPTTLDGTKTENIDGTGDVDFTFPKNEEITVAKDGNVEFEIYGNTGTIESGDVVSGNFVKTAFDCTNDANNTLEAVGDSQEKLTVSSTSITCGVSNADIAANPIFLRKTIPTFAILAVNTGNKITYGSDQDVFKFTVTASSGSDVGLSRVTLSISQAGLSTGNTALGATDGFKLYNDTVDKNAVVASATWNQTTNQVIFNAATEQVISKGQTVTFRVTGNLLDDGLQNTNSFSAVLVEDILEDVDDMTVGTQRTVTKTAAAASGTNVGNKIIWSDISANGHSVSTVDWTNSYKLGIPTISTSLS
ncbi:hypothetical protein HY605_00510, partial [Candidatus Peregrinibacteria bacterium]|nr:hypothetical protein [Candidatus Peregrinibacteria bacterium]